MTTTVRNLKDRRGGGYDPTNPEHVYIGRSNSRYGVKASKWANPFLLKHESQRQNVIAKYGAYLRRNPDLMAALPELRGKTLWCYCAPKACHGDLLARLADGVAA